MSLALIAVAVVNRTLGEWWLPDWGTGGWAIIFGSWIVLANAVVCRRVRVVEFAAYRAYSLYLVHVEAIVLAKKLPVPVEVQCAAALALAFALAEVLYRAVELPFNRLRDRWKPASTVRS